MGCKWSHSSRKAAPTPDNPEPAEHGGPDAPSPKLGPGNPEPSEGGGFDRVRRRRVIAFTAKLNIADSSPYHSGVLKFADVIANEGGAYSPDTGVFTCPVDGFYHFTVHMSVYGRAQCAIYKNGKSVASLYHTSEPDRCSQVASVSSVLQLSEKDKVWVNLWGHGRHDIIATEDNDTVFVGFYLD